MSKVIKLVIGIILLGISGFYLLGCILVIADAKEDAAYSLDYYIQIEQKECEYLGKDPVIEGREEKIAEGYEDYGFYKVTFEVKNLSSIRWYGELHDMLTIHKGAYGEDVGRVITYFDEGHTEYFETADPALPGKASVDLVYYLEVKEGVNVVSASYRPSWDEDLAELEIVLKPEY